MIKVLQQTKERLEDVRKGVKLCSLAGSSLSDRSLQC